MSDRDSTLRLWRSGEHVVLSADELVCVRDEAIAHVVINRPAKRNALTNEIWRDISRTMRWLEEDESVKLVVLRGAGTAAFSAGADINEFPTVYRDLETTLSYNADVHAAQVAVEQLSKPTLALIYGVCVGGGCGLSMACDLRFAAEDSRLGITPSKLGTAYSPSDTRRLVALVGAARAKDMLFSGRLLTAPEANVAGLVDHVAPAAELEGRAAEYARGLLANSQHSIRIAKAVVNGVAGICPRPNSELQELFEESFQSPDFQEGFAAFMAKRPPRFR